MENVHSEMSAVVMPLKEWVITVVISLIPMVNFIMLLVWSFSDSINPSKKNWARATLIVFAIVFVVYLLFAFIFMGVLMSAGGLDSM